MADHFAVPLRDLSDDGILTEPVKRGFSTELFTAAVCEFLAEYVESDQEQPFFTYLAYTSPHDPYSPAPEYVDFYPEGSVPLPGNFMGAHPFAFDNMTIRDENLTGWPRKPEVVQAILADYYGLISHMDQQIGEIVDLLKKNRLYDNTIIVYASDNGLAIGSHGLLGKQNLYEHSTKIPLIIKGPGLPRNNTVDALVYLHDIFPTLTDLAGLPVPDGLDGQSMVEIIHGTGQELRNSLFTAYRHTVRAIRDKEWKLIRYPERNYSQLFHLKSDPLELKNVADLPENANRLKALTNLLKEWQVNSGDTARLTYTHPQSMIYDPTKLTRKPDQWQPTYILNKYFEEY
jgi:arylsulfatase A-like enzyme